MLSRTLILALLGTVIATATAEARGAPVVAIDYQWLKANAEFWCEFPDSAAPACSLPGSAVGDFIRTLETRISIEPLCHGITFFLDDPSHPSRKWPQSTDYWLMIDFVPGHASQSWTAVPIALDNTWFEGKGTPKAIARDLCAAISGRGGSVLH